MFLVMCRSRFNPFLCLEVVTNTHHPALPPVSQHTRFEIHTISWQTDNCYTDQQTKNELLKPILCCWVECNQFFLPTATLPTLFCT